MDSWKCEFCAEFTPNFKNVCWNCNRKREDSVAAGQATPAAVPVPGVPESVETRWVRLSLIAFFWGLAGIITGFIWTVYEIFETFNLRTGTPYSLPLVLGLGLIIASAASLIVSIVWGLRVVKSRRHVLWWVIPAGFLAAFFGVPAVVIFSNLPKS